MVSDETLFRSGDVLACFHISRYLIPGFQSSNFIEFGLADNYMPHMS